MPLIKRNIARLKSNQIDEIQLRLVLARQFKKLRQLFGSRKPNKDFEEYFKEQFDLSPATYRYHINYLDLLERYRQFQHIPHSFREIRNNIGRILDYLDSEEAENLLADNYLSQAYWKKCPESWNILPIEIKCNVVTAVTNPPLRNTSSNTNPPVFPISPSTDDSVSVAMSNSSL